MQCNGIGPHLVVRGNSHSFSQVEAGTCFIFSSFAGMILQTRVCSAMSGLLSSNEGLLKNLLESWQGNTDASQGEAGDPVSLSICHSAIGIPINFQKKKSGIVTF